MKKSLICAVAVVTVLSLSGCGSSSGDKLEPVNIKNPKPIDKNMTVPEISESNKTEFLNAINNVRTGGYTCECDKNSKNLGECTEDKYMPSVPSLKWNGALYLSAYEHNRDMIHWPKERNLSHQGSGTKWDYTAQVQNLHRGSLWQERAQNNGYIGFVGENLVAGTRIISADDAMNSLLHSYGHCINIMNKAYKEVGVSYVHEENDTKGYRYYWTQDFGTAEQ